MENPIRMDDLGVPPFEEPPIYQPKRSCDLYLPHLYTKYKHINKQHIMFLDNFSPSQTGSQTQPQPQSSILSFGDTKNHTSNGAVKVQTTGSIVI